MTSPRMAVLGLGNLMRTDDAVGMLALQQLRADPRLASTVLLIEGGTLGLDLLHPLEGVTHLLALDAVDTGSAPGTLVRFAGDDLEDLPIAKSVHLLGFSDLLGALHLTGSVLREVVVLGVQPAAIEWGTVLTPLVETGMARLVEATLQQIGQWARETKKDRFPSVPVALTGSLAAAGESEWYW